MQPFTTGLILIGFAAAGLYFLYRSPWEPERRRNLETSPDWDEAWERIQQAYAYHLHGDNGHARLRIMEAMHHADKLPEPQRQIVLEKIDDLMDQLD